MLPSPSARPPWPGVYGSPELGAKQPDAESLLVLGNSVAFGRGVEEEQLFSTRLAEQLSAQTGWWSCARPKTSTWPSITSAGGLTRGLTAD